jgi:hypothetical protein
MVDTGDTFDMGAAFAKLEAKGQLQTKATATQRAKKADNAVDGRKLRSRGRKVQINLKVTPTFDEMIRRKAEKGGFESVAMYVIHLVEGDQR